MVSQDGRDTSPQAVAQEAPRAPLRLPEGSVVALVLGGILALLVLPPLAVLLQMSFTADVGGEFTLEHYAGLLSDPRLAATLFNTIVFSVGATAVSLLFGGVLAWIVERTNAPLKPLAYLTAIISMGTPYVLYVTAWLFLFGRVGPFNDLYRLATGSTGNLFEVHSLTGMILIEGFLWSPLVFLMLSASFRAANAEMEEAARMSGASVFTTMRRISLGLARPAILAMAMFVFIRNIEAFEVPALVGIPNRIYLLTTDIYVSVKEVPPRLGHGSAFSVVMILMLSLLLAAYSRISRNAERYASITGRGYRPRPFDLGPGRWAAGGLILVNFVIVLALPLAALLWSALMPFPRPMRPSAIGLMTLKNFEAVLSATSYARFAWNTVFAAAAAATLAMALTVVIGWIAARRRPGWAALDQLVTLPLVFPGVVLGIAFMQIALRLPFPAYGTVGLIALAFMVRYMPYGMRYAYSGALQVHREMEEAASVHGAGVPRMLVRVVAPLLGPSIVTGWLFIFLIAAKELSMAILLSEPGSQLMSVAMFDLWSNGQQGELSALGLVWAAAMTVLATALYLIGRRQTGGAFGV